MYDPEFAKSYADGLQGLLAASQASGAVLSHYPTLATAPQLKEMLNSGSDEDKKQLETFAQMLKDLGLQPGGAPDPLAAAAIGIGQLKVLRSSPGPQMDASIIETLQATLHVYVAAYRTMATTAIRLDKQKDSDSFTQLSEYMQKKDAAYDKLAKELAAA